MSDERSVARQLVLNLECLGFNASTVVLGKVPAHGLPARYGGFRLSPDMFEAPNGAAAEVVLYFLLENLPWEPIADLLPTAAGLAPLQTQQIRTRLVDSARMYLQELSLSFPCAEAAQLTAFKKNAALLLDLLKHTLPCDMGHSRRLLAEAGPRLSWVCLRLSSYILQHLATGGINPQALSGPASRVRANVLKCGVVRDTLRLQKASEEYVEAAAAIERATAAISGDYESAKQQLADATARVSSADGGQPSMPCGVVPPETLASVQRRKAVLADITELSNQRKGVEAALKDPPQAVLSQASLNEAWRAAGGVGNVPGSRRHPAGHSGVDVTGLVTEWVTCLKRIEEAACVPPAATPATPRTRGARRPSGGPPSVLPPQQQQQQQARSTHAGAAPPSLSELAADCDGQAEALTALLEHLRQQNDAIDGRLRPKLERELVALDAALDRSPLSALIADTKAASPTRSETPPPRPLAVAPVPQAQRVIEDEAWLFTPSQFSK
ncbi:hypothetical protein DIPPA_08211 [Diplonema papillatum]|nr:hypothetical protein DIPPA_08211 [Diplonema papillatum]|eukprot:gene3417-5347_t